MNVTLVDIAVKLGLHPSTVSLALRDSPRIAEATRARVRATADEMGYRVNPYVSALMSSRRRGDSPSARPVIALVTAGRTPDESTYGYNVQEFISGCETTARDLGFTIEHFWIGEPGLNAACLNQQLRDRGIQGAILLSSGDWRARMTHPWQGLAIVKYGILESVPTFDWVQANHHGNMEMLLVLVRGEGFRRIGLAMETPYLFSNLNPWLAVYMLEQTEQCPGQALDPWLASDPGFEGFRSWMDTQQPEVVVCVRPTKVLGWLSELGLRVPEDISVVTLGTAEIDGPVSGIVEKARISSRLALEMLLDRIHHNEFGHQEMPRHITVSGQWNRGTTLRSL